MFRPDNYDLSGPLDGAKIFRTKQPVSAMTCVLLSFLFKVVSPTLFLTGVVQAYPFRPLCHVRYSGGIVELAVGKTEADDTVLVDKL